MTENEAIKRCDMLINGLSINNATNRAFEEDGKDYPTFATMKEFAKTCKNALEEIQQYRAIGIVEEFKALKEKETEILLKDGQFLYQQGLVDGYAKAIDEFAEKLSLEISESIIWGILSIDCKDSVSDEIFNYVIDTSKQIAEQLKAGVKNE